MYVAVRSIRFGDGTRLRPGQRISAEKLRERCGERLDPWVPSHFRPESRAGSWRVLRELVIGDGERRGERLAAGSLLPDCVGSEVEIRWWERYHWIEAVKP